MRKKMDKPKTPTLDRLMSVKNKSQAIGEFLEWLQGDQKIQLMRYHEHVDSCVPDGGWDDFRCGFGEDAMVPEYRSIEQLLASFFDVDLKKVESERMELLEWVRSQNR